MSERGLFVYNHEVRNIGERKRGHFEPSYSALAMAMSYQGTSVASQDVFGFFYGPNSPIEGALVPTFGDMALAAQELSKDSLFPLKATVWDSEKYSKLNEKRTPFDVMDAYLLGRNTPCIIRAQGQPWLVTGVEPITRSYRMYDPYHNFTDRYKKVWFDHWWSQEDPQHPRAEYLMLTIEKDKKYF